MRVLVYLIFDSVLAFFLALEMTTPNYKLKDDMVVTAKHLRTERIRNDSQY